MSETKENKTPACLEPSHEWRVVPGSLGQPDPKVETLQMLWYCIYCRFVSAGAIKFDKKPV